MSGKDTVTKRVPGMDAFYHVNEPPIGTLVSPDILPQNARAPKLFEPLTIRGVTFKNRIWVSPMCQYSSEDGLPSDWHLVHIGGFATRGPGAITMEATAVLPEGRIMPHDAGIWSDKHIAPLKRIVDFVHSQGTIIGLQLAHAGLVGPGDTPFVSTYATPKPLTLEGIQRIEQAYADAVKRAVAAGFDFIDIHGAHGFCSPLSNKRTNQHGGSLENRIRLSLQIAKRVRAELPADKPLFYRTSATDWADGPEHSVQGEWLQWGIEQNKIFAAELQKVGVDLIDCSTGGNWYQQKIPIGPGYQIPFAAAIKTALPTMLVTGVGLITDPHQAEGYLQEGKVDAVMIGTEMMRRADWPLFAAQELRVGAKPAVQYERAWERMLRPRLN